MEKSTVIESGQVRCLASDMPRRSLSPTPPLFTLTVKALVARPGDRALDTLGVVQVGGVADAGARHQRVGRRVRRNKVVALPAAGAGARVHARIAAGHHGQGEVADRALARRFGQVANLAGVELGGVQGGVDQDGLVPGGCGVDGLVHAILDVLRK